MHASDVFRKKFSKDATRGFGGQTALSELGLFLGGVLLAKMGDDGLRLDGEEERILTLLSIALGRAASPLALGHLRRVSKHWQRGDKCLAAIHLAQSGLGKLDAQAAYRLSLAAELIDAGIAPSELARKLGLGPFQLDIRKYDENQPRVPAGSGRASGQWTSGDAAAGGDALVAPHDNGGSTGDAAAGGNPSSLVEGRSAAANAGEINRVRELPKDAIVVTRPDCTTIDDPSSPTKKLMAPPRANFQEVYAAGEKIANRPKGQQITEAKAALQQFGTYDFQRDKATNTYFDEYVPAANYAVGVYMAGAGYDLAATYVIAEGYATFNSSNWHNYWSRGRPWIKTGWEDAQRGDWQTK
jgi:hypothetical protein